MLLLVSVAAAAAKKPKLKTEDVVQRHLDSLGSVENRANWKSCKFEGSGSLQILAGGGGELQGPSTFLSHGRKLKFSIGFGWSDYPAEEISYDGDEVEVGQLSAGRRSYLGEFLYFYDEIIAEGLFGGVLSTGWSLLDLEERKPKLNYDGLKDVDGVEYYTLRYRPRKRSDVEIRIYFDPETFRHCVTIYKVRISEAMGTRPGQSRQEETRYTLKENFADFQEQENAVTVPLQWNIDLTIEAGVQTSLLRWSMNYGTIQVNPEIDAGQFLIR
jgi:hypothetical protein